MKMTIITHPVYIKVTVRGYYKQLHDQKKKKKKGRKKEKEILSERGKFQEKIQLGKIDTRKKNIKIILRNCFYNLKGRSRLDR